mmetsp:Transcript_28015/g.80643  ORF Transcript_28015/g.80643 Transcript_28015/m.80643 type:complete len:227 (-) Transcript_28015:733-1413(-)
MLTISSLSHSKSSKRTMSYPRTGMPLTSATVRLSPFSCPSSNSCSAAAVSSSFTFRNQGAFAGTPVRLRRSHIFLRSPTMRIVAISCSSFSMSSSSRYTSRDSWTRAAALGGAVAANAPLPVPEGCCCSPVGSSSSSSRSMVMTSRSEGGWGRPVACTWRPMPKPAPAGAPMPLGGCGWGRTSLPNTLLATWPLTPTTPPLTRPPPPPPPAEAAAAAAAGAATCCT